MLCSRIVIVGDTNGHLDRAQVALRYYPAEQAGGQILKGRGNNSALSPEWLDPWSSQRPDLVCDAAKGAPHTAAQWFLPACYAMPASPFLPGTGPRTLPDVRSDGSHNLDASLLKEFSFSERTRLQFQLAAFNVANSVQLGIPNAYWNPANLASFGQVTYAASRPRQFQFGLRFIY